MLDNTVTIVLQGRAVHYGIVFGVVNVFEGHVKAVRRVRELYGSRPLIRGGVVKLIVGNLKTGQNFIVG